MLGAQQSGAAFGCVASKQRCDVAAVVGET